MTCWQTKTQPSGVSTSAVLFADPLGRPEPKGQTKGVARLHNNRHPQESGATHGGQPKTIAGHKQAKYPSIQLQMMNIRIDGSTYTVEVGERLIDVINRVGKELPQVCYHPQLGPIQTCDTCLVEVNGQLARACGTTVSAGMQ